MNLKGDNYSLTHSLTHLNEVEKPFSRNLQTYLWKQSQSHMKELSIDARRYAVRCQNEGAR